MIVRNYISYRDNIVINDDRIDDSTFIIELEGDETIESIKEDEDFDHTWLGLNPVYVKFVEYSANLSEEELESVAFYYKGAGYAFEIVENKTKKPSNKTKQNEEIKTLIANDKIFNALKTSKGRKLYLKVVYNFSLSRIAYILNMTNRAVWNQLNTRSRDLMTIKSKDYATLKNCEIIDKAIKLNLFII